MKKIETFVPGGLTLSAGEYPIARAKQAHLPGPRGRRPPSRTALYAPGPTPCGSPRSPPEPPRAYSKAYTGTPWNFWKYVCISWNEDWHLAESFQVSSGTSVAQGSEGCSYCMCSVRQRLPCQSRCEATRRGGNWTHPVLLKSGGEAPRAGDPELTQALTSDLLVLQRGRCRTAHLLQSLDGGIQGPEEWPRFRPKKKHSRRTFAPGPAQSDSLVQAKGKREAGRFSRRKYESLWLHATARN